MKNIHRIVKPDLKHFKQMAKVTEPREEHTFWEYLIAYSENELARINKNENRL